MKLGIVTCHDVYNFGASLQAYGLSTFLRRNGVENEIIDYKPDYLYRLIDFMEVDAPKWQTSMLRRWIYRIYMVPIKVQRLKKYSRFKRFNRVWLQLSSRQYKTEEELRRKNDYFCCICGSDQIWNSMNYECGRDPVFYLSFFEAGKKISYAASFGCDTVSEKGEENIQRYLRDFHAVSVRESSGVNLLSAYGVQAEHVLDPVFFLDCDEWRQLKSSKGNISGKYILVYGYDNDPSLEDAVRYYSERKKCKVITIQNSRQIRDAGPREFLTLIDNADMVITSSFHAIAFSILLRTPFVAISTGNTPLFERINDILKTTDMESRQWRLMRTDDMRNAEMDFEQVDQLLGPAIERSKAFLLNAVLGE